MNKVACLFLCAGKSRRMEGSNKLLTIFRFDAGSKRETVVEVSAQQVLAAPFIEYVAVTGFEASSIQSKIQEAGFGADEITHNHEFEAGMHASIRAGLRHLSCTADFFAIALADQPLLRASDYGFLIDQLRFHSNAKIICPMYRGRRGNPTLISMQLRDEILNHEDSDRGCSYLFSRYPQEVAFVEMPTTAVDLDVDTNELMNKAREIYCGNSDASI